MVLHYLLASSSLHQSCSATLPSLLGSACSCKHCFFHLEHFLTETHSLSCFVFLLKYYLWDRTFLRISLEPFILLFLHGLCHYPHFLFYSICSVSFRHASLPFFRATISVCMVGGCCSSSPGREREEELPGTQVTSLTFLWEEIGDWATAELRELWSAVFLGKYGPAFSITRQGDTYLMDSLWLSSTIDLKNWKTILPDCS